VKLTERGIENLTCEAVRRDRLVFDDEQKGPGIRVTTAGSRSYLVQYRDAGKKRRVPLGSCSGISLAEARKSALKIMGQNAGGRDEWSERKASAAEARRKAAQEALTLPALIEQWAILRLTERRARYAAEAVRALRHAFAKHLDTPAAGLDRAAVVRVLVHTVAAPLVRRNHRDSLDFVRGSGWLPNLRILPP
jgi:Arm DNA-binding domain